MAVFEGLKRARSSEPSASAMQDLRVLVMSHSHPRLTRGGAEISAGALCRGLTDSPGVHAWFLGCSTNTSASRLGANLTQPFGPNDFLYTPGAPFEYFKFANRDPNFPRVVEELLVDLRPDIVHAHHYTMFGVETFSIIRRAVPSARIVVTLHEFLAICHNHGQMVKTETHRLCRQASPIECARCFPHLAPRDFFLRRLYIQKFLADVDLFLSPSHFLAERYVAWGLPAARVRVLENVPPFDNRVVTTAATGVHRSTSTAGRDIHIGFFGQMSPLKGIVVLIEAAAELERAGNTRIVIDIFGDYSNQPSDFQARVADALANAGRNVEYHGPYDNSEVLGLMSKVDAVIVPSIWWENSPVVIQEALLVGRPVICSDIGGLAEKVRPGIDGFHFSTGQPRSLARVLQSITEKPEILEKLSMSLQKPWSPDEALRNHLDIYNTLRATPRQ